MLLAGSDLFSRMFSGCPACEVEEIKAAGHRNSPFPLPLTARSNKLRWRRLMACFIKIQRGFKLIPAYRARNIP
jgi:hypothetical protein